MRQERPVLRVSHQGSSIDITAGQPWYVGIGAACNVRLPVKGPAEAWFVVRHAGVWTVRAVDARTQMWLDGVALSSDRSIRIGMLPSQELRARRGDAEVSLIVTAPGSSLAGYPGAEGSTGLPQAGPAYPANAPTTATPAPQQSPRQPDDPSPRPGATPPPVPAAAQPGLTRPPQAEPAYGYFPDYGHPAPPPSPPPDPLQQPSPDPLQQPAAPAAQPSVPPSVPPSAAPSPASPWTPPAGTVHEGPPSPAPAQSPAPSSAAAGSSADSATPGAFSSPDSAPVLRQAEPPAAAEVLRDTPSRAFRPPDLAAPSAPAGTPPAGPAGSNGPPTHPGSAGAATAAPAPPGPDRITSTGHFLALMKNYKWPGFLQVPGPAGRAVVLRRSITAGSRSAQLIPSPPGDPAASLNADAAARTIYELLCPGGQRFPSGHLRDVGLVLSTNGRAYSWKQELLRDISVIDAPPPSLGRNLTGDIQLAEISDDELLPLLDAAARRILSSGSTG